ncbi:MAG: substrate-binding domain-containing protein [Xanthomonadaceae bacterium]|nr:substrate-binding domain-containing protein [Xanthomonadaceae bacterium]
MLTQEGKEFKSRITPILDEFNRTMTGFQNNQDQAAGTIRIGCLPEVGQSFFYGLLLEYQDLNPEVKFQAHFGLQTETIPMLKTGDLDFTIVWHPLLSENVRSYHLLEERSVLVTRTQNKKAFSDFESAQWITYEKRDLLLFQFLKLYAPRKKAFALKNTSSVNSQQSMVQALLNQDAFAVLPLFTVEPYIRSKKLKIASDVVLKNDLYLLHLENQMLTKRASLFKKFILNRCRSQTLVSGFSVSQQVLL